MTIEEKSKAYDEALERARKLYERGTITESLGYVFPELSESEDERIRGAIIDHLKDNNLTEWAAWLEKQGDSPIKWYKNTKDYKPQKYHSVLMKTTHGIAEGEWNGEHWIQYRWSCIIKDSDVIAWMVLSSLEKQGEQKPDDKVEPKFKVGDFIVNDYCMGKVIELTGDAYLLDTGQGIPFSCEHNAHLWTIADAKNGDVLSDGTTIFIFKDLLSDGSVMSYCDCDTDSGESDAFCPLSVNLMCSKITPATKERRDTLFAKMHEAGYMWDSESKQLLSLKAKPSGKKKPAWSEEDEQHIDSLLKRLDGLCRNEFERTRFAINEDKDWLESLKQRIGG